MTTSDFEPTQAHSQFLTGRTKLLDDLDRARTHAQSHEIETRHGVVAEASFREWLSEFLPKRFGVCSGYIVSQGAGEADLLPKYDVMIFDQLESPVLWIDHDADTKPDRAAQAIPAEYVRAVIEVKATLTSTSASKAIEHLGDLRPLLASIDAPDERYPKYLCEDFFSAFVAFDLKSEKRYSAAVLDNLVPDQPLRGYWGGHILRGEGLDGVSAKLHCCQGDALPGNVGPSKASLLDLNAGIFSNSKFVGGTNTGMLLGWGASNFAEFAFDLLALLKGTYPSNRMSSFHARNLRIGTR